MPNRTLCAVLEEMRATYKTRNFASLLGLIEEAQSMGNRMESSLYDQKSIKAMEKKYRKLKVALNQSEEVLGQARDLAEEHREEELKEALDKLVGTAKYRSW